VHNDIWHLEGQRVHYPPAAGASALPQTACKKTLTLCQNGGFSKWGFTAAQVVGGSLPRKRRGTRRRRLMHSVLLPHFALHCTVME